MHCMEAQTQQGSRELSSSSIEAILLSPTLSIKEFKLVAAASEWQQHEGHIKMMHTSNVDTGTTNTTRA